MCHMLELVSCSAVSFSSRTIHTLSENELRRRKYKDESTDICRPLTVLYTEHQMTCSLPFLFK
jgi:hypothetical protein